MNVMKRDFSKSIVAAVVTLNVLFAAAVLYLVYIGREEPTELVRMWFAFTSIELLALAGIRKAKMKRGDSGD